MHSSVNATMPRAVAVLAAVLLLATAPASRNEAATQAKPDPSQPVVVELFTSQGCNSCPPADELVVELTDQSDVIALSLHVDYWDYIGWKDPYGSPMNTERQRRYGEALRLRYVFTPQIIVDGRTSLVGSRRGAVLRSIERSRVRGKPLKLEIVNDDGGKVIIPAGHAPDVGATVWLVVYDRHHETDVTRGENAGRTIRNGNVVRRFERLGTWMGERTEIPLDLSAAAARGHDGCAVIVQQGRYGPVLGAAAMSLDDLGG